MISTLTMLLSGCGKNNYEKIKVMEYKDTVLNLDEVSLWQAILEAEFEEAAGSSNVWLEDGAKEQAKTELEFRLKQVLVLTQKSKEENITLSNEELETVKEDAKTFFDQLEESEIETLGLTLSTVEIVYEKNALFSKLLDLKTKDMEVDEEKIYSTLEENSEYIYFLNTPIEEIITKARVKHLLIKTFTGEQPTETTNYSAEDKKAAKIEAEQLFERVKDGEDFVKLITEYSEDEASLANEGEYTFTYKEMTHEFSDAAFDMEIGEIRLVESIFGYHIMRLEEIIKPTPEEITEFEKVIKDYDEYLRNNLLQVQKQEFYTPIYAEWEKEAEKDIKVVQKQWNKIEMGKGIGN
jgi:parvulin-like peptidyl-prolyl isomerase